jgi:hypothetical protein
MFVALSENYEVAQRRVHQTRLKLKSGEYISKEEYNVKAKY